MSLTYPALVHRASKKGADYGVIFPDFPGAVFGGASLEQAIENAREGIIFHVESLLNDGESLPDPSTLAELMNAHKKQKTSSSISFNF